MLITIAACKTASAKRVTAVLPLFPYSRQPDIPYLPSATGAPSISVKKDEYTFESLPGTPNPLSQPDQEKQLGVPSTPTSSDGKLKMPILKSTSLNQLLLIQQQPISYHKLMLWVKLKVDTNNGFHQMVL